MEAEYAEAVKKLAFPPENQDLWVVPMIPGVRSNKVVSTYRRLKVNVYVDWDDLDAKSIKNDRDPNRNGAYLIGFKRTIEADGENANKSANQLVEAKHKGIVLCEQLVLGFGYYVTTGQHLGVKNITLCSGSGSRYSSGGVPVVYWVPNDGEVCVDWRGSGYSSGTLRSRSVLFLSRQ